MAQPVRGDWLLIKKICRYLQHSRRVAMVFKEQPPQPQITVYTDTDYAGCRRTRRSTNGGMVLPWVPLVQELVHDTDGGGAQLWRGRVLWRRKGRVRGIGHR